MNKKLNWKPDHFLKRFGTPFRDYGLPATSTIPSSLDLRPHVPPIVDQGDLGSCTANAWAYLLGTIAMQGVNNSKTEPEEFSKKFSPLSRLFIYYNERRFDGDIYSDNGSTLTSGMKSIQNWGVCQETTWPYLEKYESICPPSFAYAEALNHLIPYGSILTSSQLGLKKSLFFNKTPFVFGINVYSSFWNTGTDGIVSMPNPQVETLEGGHALCCIGFDDSKQAFIIMNSWGTSWGDQGFCYIPYTYLTDPNLASDFWNLTL